MATVEFLKKIIKGAEQKLEKLNKKLVRILKAEESNYEKNNPYYYNDYDKRSTLREIEECKKNLQMYGKDLSIAIEKENSRNVQVIIDFLQTWKEKVYETYKKDMMDYYDLSFEFHEESRKCGYGPKSEKYEELRQRLNHNLKGVWEQREYMNSWGNKSTTKVKIADGKWEHLSMYVFGRNSAEAFKLLEKDLEKEAIRKYDFIIERTNKIVGEITDVSNLHIADNGELNGFIVGTRGKAKVTTIIANGPIRIAHFRVLIKEIK